MKRTAWLQETKQMRFQEAYQGWTERRLTQEEAARILGVSVRSFRRYRDGYQEAGLEGLRDKRLTQVSPRRAPVDEVLRLVDRYQRYHDGWSVKHYYAWYRRDGGARSYSWVKNTLQAAGAVKKTAKRGAPRKRREAAPWPGMLLHQDGSTHEWVPGHHWDLIVTMDDATNEHYSMFFCEEEGTQSSFQGLREVLEQQGFCCSLYTARGSHYWHTSEAGGKVDKGHLTQFGRAMKQLGIEMIPAYSPEARGRSERAFETHQGRLPQELALAGITDLAAANASIRTMYLPAFNTEFAHPSREAGSAFVPCPASVVLDDILCEQEERTVGQDNCVRLDGRVLQLPTDRHRYHYIKAKVKVCRHMDGTVSGFHGPRRLARYDENGQVLAEQLPTAA